MWSQCRAWMEEVRELGVLLSSLQKESPLVLINGIHDLHIRTSFCTSFFRGS